MNSYVYEILTLGKPQIENRVQRHHDVLSGLRYGFREVVIKHCNRVLFEVVWDRSYYKLKIFYSPITIRILVDRAS